MNSNFLEYLGKFSEFTNEYNREIYFANQDRNDIQPPIEPEIGRFLTLLIKLTGARKVLELGCGVANSTIWLAQELKNCGGTVCTVDNHPRTWNEAIVNIEKAGVKDQVRMIHANAEDAVRQLLDEGETFDLIFQDCGKYVYNVIYEDVYSLLKKGGLIAADDTMFCVCENVRQNLGRHMDAYNQKIFADQRFFSAMIPIGHGMTLSYKK